ncbi:hypothetical protein WISP_149580 [Willisornis vidua]|uniref:Uncharacterized protein n=1 Tax=Willisornis vidua TaxID=1566151 RepID=A0ABQ9CNU8_9PASS|nr:hypothetical protein WISP_149580 [Willisornis vidua]
MSSTKPPDENGTPKERKPGLRSVQTTMLFRAVNPELFIKPIEVLQPLEYHNGNLSDEGKRIHMFEDLARIRAKSCSLGDIFILGITVTFPDLSLLYNEKVKQTNMTVNIGNPDGGKRDIRVQKSWFLSDLSGSTEGNLRDPKLTNSNTLLLQEGNRKLLILQFVKKEVL